MDDFITRRSFTALEIQRMSREEYARNRDLIKAQSKNRLSNFSYPLVLRSLLDGYYRTEDLLFFSRGGIKIYASRLEGRREEGCGGKPVKFLIWYSSGGKPINAAKNARIISPDKVRKILNRCHPIF